MEGWHLILVFFIILLAARIVPRIIRQNRMNSQGMNNGYGSNDDDSKKNKFVDGMEKTLSPPNKSNKNNITEKSKSKEKDQLPESKEMIVLKQMRLGYKTFEEIRKNTRLDHKELNGILEKFEKSNLIEVKQRKGMFGIKVELYLTEEGYRKYDLR